MLINNKYDEELWNIINLENIRQNNCINLIASENYVSKNILKIQGTSLTNKYAEGYPGNRYYSGCEYIDIIEKIAIERAKLLFNADYANVQPHSGSQANFAIYNALLKPGDTVLGMNLTHGGHLTHGSPVNFSGKFYKFYSYGTDKNGIIDYKKILNLSNLYKPKMIVGGFSSYSGIIDWKRIREISDKIKAYFFVDMAHIAGLVAAKIYPSPIPYAHIVSSTTHKTLCGPRGGLILSKNGKKDFYKKIDASVFPGTQGGPLMHIIAAKAASFKEAMTLSFIKYQKQILKNSTAMLKVFINRNFDVVNGYTENHLFLIDLRKKNITGDKASNILNKSNIIVNKNCIPNDKRNPKITSGIRIGTPAITKRGLKEIECIKLSNWICDILEDFSNKILIKKIKNKIINLCYKYPIYK